MTSETKCDVILPDELTAGVFANAIRVFPDGNDLWVMDFCVYSPTSLKAQVVCRVRVKSEFMAGIQERLGRHLDDIIFQGLDKGILH